MSLIEGCTGVTWFLGVLEGAFAGTPFAARTRYTRTWGSTTTTTAGVDDGPYEGVPGHLAPTLWEWAAYYLSPQNSISSSRIEKTAQPA